VGRRINAIEVVDRESIVCVCDWETLAGILICRSIGQRMEYLCAEPGSDPLMGNGDLKTVDKSGWEERCKPLGYKISREVRKSDDKNANTNRTSHISRCEPPHHTHVCNTCEVDVLCGPGVCLDQQ
jgi:hypothetical protein